MITPKQVIFGNIPSKSNSYEIHFINGKPSIGKGGKVKEYEQNFYIQCKCRDLNITGYFELYADVFYPTERSDLDNATKILLDCLQSVKAIKNDNKCVKIFLRKFKDKENPRVEFIIKEVNLNGTTD